MGIEKLTVFRKQHPYYYTYFLLYAHNMNAELTLNLNKNIIDEVKLYASSKQISISELVENYFNSLVKSP